MYSSVRGTLSGWICLLVFLTPLLMASDTRAVERYEFASGDVLRLVVFGRPDLSGSFRVGPDDSISLPVVGSVNVAGKDSEELKQSLREIFTRAMSTEASLTLDIESYRPFFVLGSVNKPGSYPYQPGVTVLQAVAIAGGVYTLAQDPASNLVVLSHREKERLDSTTGELKLLLARRARLIAEQNGQDVVEVPTRLKMMVGDKEAARLVSEERDLMRARGQLLTSKIEAHNRMHTLAKKHIVDLKGQLGAIQRQEDLTSQELRVALELKKKGLTTDSRVFDLQRALADFAAEKLEVQSSVDEAEQDAVRIANEAVQAPLDRALEVAEDLKANEGDIALQMTALTGAADILQAITGVASTLYGARTLGPTYTVVRNIDQNFEYLDVQETDRLHPGDVLKVKHEVGPTGDASGVSGLTD